MTNNDLSLTISRIFTTSAQSTFSEWTDPQGLRSWWEPGGTTVENAQVDLRVGGHYRIKSTAPQRDLTIIISGIYREVNVPHLLVSTWTWGARSRCSIPRRRFAGDGRIQDAWDTNTRHTRSHGISFFACA